MPGGWGRTKKACLRCPVVIDFFSFFTFTFGFPPCFWVGNSTLAMHWSLTSHGWTIISGLSNTAEAPVSKNEAISDHGWRHDWSLWQICQGHWYPLVHSTGFESRQWQRPTGAARSKAWVKRRLGPAVGSWTLGPATKSVKELQLWVESIFTKWFQFQKCGARILVTYCPKKSLPIATAQQHPYWRNQDWCIQFKKCVWMWRWAVSDMSENIEMLACLLLQSVVCKMRIPCQSCGKYTHTIMQRHLSS